MTTKTPVANAVFGVNRNKYGVYDNPVEAEIRAPEKQLHAANEALAQRCNCRFNSGGFHKATCEYHERLQKRLAEAEDQIAFLTQKR